MRGKAPGIRSPWLPYALFVATVTQVRLPIHSLMGDDLSFAKALDNTSFWQYSENLYQN